METRARAQVVYGPGSLAAGFLGLILSTDIELLMNATPRPPASY